MITTANHHFSLLTLNVLHRRPQLLWRNLDDMSSSSAWRQRGSQTTAEWNKYWRIASRCFEIALLRQLHASPDLGWRCLT
eukprot:s1675_g2.t1